MKVIIAGGREVTDDNLVYAAILASGFEITEGVSGGARGVDFLGEVICEAWGIPVKVFPAHWDAHGKGAGHLRNREMAAYAQALIAVWDGQSLGTGNMIQEAKKRNLKIYIHRY